MNTLKELLPHFRLKKENMPGYREILIFIIFMIFYKISRFIAIGDEQTAFANAYQVIALEQSWGMFYEIPIQQYFLNSTVLIEFINQFYMRMHLPTIIIFFIWLYHFKRHYYIYIRNGFLLANIATLFVFILYPCAPPRMLNELGFVDTLLSVSDINLYQGNLSKLFNQYAAMPSMHFGNALLISVGCFLLAKNKWIKYGLIVYPLFVLWMIVITGNHFFLDAVLGGIIVLAPYPIMSFLLLLNPRFTWFDGGFLAKRKANA